MIWDDYIPQDDETAAILAQCKKDGSHDNTYGDSLDWPPCMARSETMPLICPGEPHDPPDAEFFSRWIAQ